MGYKRNIRKNKARKLESRTRENRNIDVEAFALYYDSTRLTRRHDDSGISKENDGTKELAQWLSNDGSDTPNGTKEVYQ